MTSKFLLDYFKKSVRADDTHLPVLNDPAYTFSDTDIEDVLKVALLAQCPEVVDDIEHIDLSKTPTDQYIFVILKAKQEIYYRLSTSSAPFYPIEAEGASLRKDYRFEHYMSLVRRVEQEYSTLWTKYCDNKEIEVGEVIIAGYHYKLRNYNKAKAPKVAVLRCIPDKEYINLEWSMFEVLGGLFSSYKVYVSLNPIYDEFEDLISEEATVKIHETDIHRTKARLKGLTANTHYHVLVESQDRNGLRGLAEFEVDTLPIKY